MSPTPSISTTSTINNFTESVPKLTKIQEENITHQQKYNQVKLDGKIQVHFMTTNTMKRLVP